LQLANERIDHFISRAKKTEAFFKMGRFQIPTATPGLMNRIGQ
jgi:hypothetical protein